MRTRTVVASIMLGVIASISLSACGDTNPGTIMEKGVKAVDNAKDATNDMNKAIQDQQDQINSIMGSN